MNKDDTARVDQNHLGVTKLLMSGFCLSLFSLKIVDKSGKQSKAKQMHDSTLMI
jgi:hypothetical protein